VPRRAIGAADSHPLSARRFAPVHQRLKRTSFAQASLWLLPPLIRSPLAQ